MTSKIIVVGSDESTALALDVVPGQAHEAPHLKPLLIQTVVRLKPNDTATSLVSGDAAVPSSKEPGQTPVRVEVSKKPSRKAVDQLAGDKAYSGQPQREVCAALGVELVCPSKKNAVHQVPLDKAAYRERNRIERLFAKAKEFRRVATRYDKLKETFLGLLHLVFGVIRLRAKCNVNRAYIIRHASHRQGVSRDTR